MELFQEAVKILGNHHSMNDIEFDTPYGVIGRVYFSTLYSNFHTPVLIFFHSSTKLSKVSRNSN